MMLEIDFRLSDFAFFKNSVMVLAQNMMSYHFSIKLLKGKRWKAVLLNYDLCW